MQQMYQTLHIVKCQERELLVGYVATFNCLIVVELAILIMIHCYI